MKLKTFLYSLAIGLAFILPASAAPAETGQTVAAGAFCLNEADAKLLTKRVAEDGNAGYQEVMRKVDSKCFDARIHRGVKGAKVILMEKVWSVVNATDGITYDFWTAVAGETIGWIWVPAPAEYQAPPPKPEA